MNLPFLFARRYLLAKRKQQAVNIITLISIVVVAVVTAAMVVVLSALNGISELVETMYSPFDQDLTVTPAVGKNFGRDTVDLDAIYALDGVARASWVIQENVLLRAGDQQVVATMKGVEPQYLAMSHLKDHMYMGEPQFQNQHGPVVILGAGLKDALRVPLDDGVLEPLEVAALIRGRKLASKTQVPFDQRRVAVAGAFTINMEFDQQYMLAPIDWAADLLKYGDEVNALEIQTAPKAQPERLKKELEKIIGPGFIVKTRYQKNELMYTTNANEKWFTFVVLAFIGLIGAFNIIASLTLMMIEKQRDMGTMAGMGATDRFARRVFFTEGLLIVMVGTAIGLLLGLGLCVLQITTGVIAMEGAVVEAYPVKVLASDLGMIFIAVMIIGTLAAWVPLRSLSRRYLATAR